MSRCHRVTGFSSIPCLFSLSAWQTAAITSNTMESALLLVKKIEIPQDVGLKSFETSKRIRRTRISDASFEKILFTRRTSHGELHSEHSGSVPAAGIVDSMRLA